MWATSTRNSRLPGRLFPYGWGVTSTLLDQKNNKRYRQNPQYRAEVFNRAANEDLALATLPVWRDVHPLLRTVPTDWGVTVSYGVLHAPEPAPHVAEFLDAVHQVAG